MKLIISLIFICMLYGCAVLRSQEKINALPDDLHESSGLQLLPSGNLASINDSGNDEVVYIVDSKGKKLKEIKVENSENNDWEALTMDENGRLYVGNFGNNENKRKDLSIYVLPSNIEQKNDVKPEYIIKFHYSDQEKFPPDEDKMRFDCEAMYANEGYIYLFSKSRVNPFEGKSYIYRIPNEFGDHTAEMVGCLELCQKGQFKCWVTDAAAHHETQKLAILTTKRMYYYQLPDSSKWNMGQLELLGVQKLKGIKQREAITFKENNDTLYMTDEKHKLLGGGNLYKLKVNYNE